MFQRAARMKPHLSSFDNPTITVESLIKFVRNAQHALEQAKDMESAVTFECLAEYLEHDYKQGTPLKFEGRAIGL
jgi:hypothetical protein